MPPLKITRQEIFSLKIYIKFIEKGIRYYIYAYEELLSRKIVKEKRAREMYTKNYRISIQEEKEYPKKKKFALIEDKL